MVALSADRSSCLLDSISKIHDVASSVESLRSGADSGQGLYMVVWMFGSRSDVVRVAWMWLE